MIEPKVDIAGLFLDLDTPGTFCMSGRHTMGPSKDFTTISKEIFSVPTMHEIRSRIYNHTKLINCAFVILLKLNKENSS